MAPCSPFLTMQLAIPSRVRGAENGAGCKHIKCCGQEEPVDLASFPGLLSPLWNLSFMGCLLSAVASEPSDLGCPKLSAPTCGVLLPKLSAPACGVLLPKLSAAYLPQLQVSSLWRSAVLSRACGSYLIYIHRLCSTVRPPLQPPPSCQIPSWEVLSPGVPFPSQ